MLLALGKASLCVMLFLLMYICIRAVGLTVMARQTARSRLSAKRRTGKVPVEARIMPVYGHLKDLMDATRFIRSVGMFAAITLLLILAGIVCGALVFRSLRGVAVLAVVWGLLPYLLLRLRLISRQLKIRLEFLPAVEVFYQQVVLTARPNMRNVLQAVVAGDRLLYPIKPSFEQLQRNLSTGRDTEDALRIFQLELGHVWSDYFVNMLRMAIIEGMDIAPNLKELIEDMRRAQLYDQKVRNRLLEIRLASFSPVLFLFLFLSINFKLNYHNSLHFYFMDSGGRNMLLNALLLISGSFAMGIYLSMKRM